MTENCIGWNKRDTHLKHVMPHFVRKLDAEIRFYTLHDINPIVPIEVITIIVNLIRKEVTDSTARNMRNV